MRRIWKNVAIENGCWNWLGSKNRKGYGKTRIGSRTDGTRRMVFVHRLVWSLIHGPIPAGLLVCHRCDNPSCIKPGHLFLGTNDENMRDMVRKGRLKTRWGELNPCSKLTAKDVVEIKQRLSRGESPTDMVRDYPVTRELIYAIRKGRVWASVQIDAIMEKRKAA